MGLLFDERRDCMHRFEPIMPIGQGRNIDRACQMAFYNRLSNGIHDFKRGVYVAFNIQRMCGGRRIKP